MDGWRKRYSHEVVACYLTLKANISKVKNGGHYFEKSPYFIVRKG